MNVTAIVMLFAVVLLAAAVVAVIMTGKRRERSASLKNRFGSEYDRALDERGGRKPGEAHLADVAHRRDGLEIRELSAQEREGYTQRWVAVQAMFIDQPAGAVRDADYLVDEVMRVRGYPVDDFGTKVDMVAIDHPHVAEHYRAAHAAGSFAGRNDTEAQRQAFVHYRALFAELVSAGEHGRHAQPAEQIDLTAHADRSEVAPGQE